MLAELIEIFPTNIDTRKLGHVVECLKAGGIIIYPTDTVYSMGCMSSHVKAVEKLCKLKNMKPEQNRFSIVCSDLKDIATYAKVSNQAFRILKQILPGPFTVILPATGDLPKILQTKRKTIGIRIPEHAIPQAIIELLGVPLITTSLKDDIDDIIEYPNEIEVIFEQNMQNVDIVLSGGWCGIIPSTVIDLTDDTEYKVLREGVGEISF
jgi:tRNA threonylcarbamoyl adenosine modification protein (Sua5/YciO/YrdC/YwlC family)